MKKIRVWIALFGISVGLHAGGMALERTILLPRVKGRIDHFGLDRARGRLFVSALGNNTVEVVDLKEGKVVHSIVGLSEPQGNLYLGGVDLLYVANGGDGTLRTYDGTSYAPTRSLPLGDDADNLRSDASVGQILVGYGSGALAFVDAASGQKTGEIELPGHPEAFQMEKAGARVFVNIPRAHQIAVLDRRQMKLLTTWATGSVSANFPMALDEDRHRLLIGCRSPARLLILNTDSGHLVAALELDGDCDDLYFDAPRRQIYASCGKGYLDLFVQASADRYAIREKVATAAGARTCGFDGRYLYLGVPRRGDEPAAIRCYRLSP